MKCATCQHDNTEDSLFCKKCGTKLPLADGAVFSWTRTIRTSPAVLEKETLVGGKYRIVGEIGAGGMGIVYKAVDTKLWRPVALKFLPPELSRHPEAKARFLREAHAAAVLDHPHIGTIFETGEHEDTAFIAMAFIEGQSLGEKIARGPLGTEETLDLAIQIAEGLEEAHRKGIIHRDIKSANVMVTEKGQAKIMDFGLAKVTGESPLTDEAKTMGTVAYMSPEQARGKEVDGRTDIWSLGVVIYEMLSGRLPFSGEREAAILYAIVHEEPKPLKAVKPDIPGELERIIDRALAKRPESRYASAGDMLAELRKFLELRRAPQAGAFNLRALWRRVRRPAVAVPILVMVLVLASLAVLFFRRQAKVRYAREQLLPRIEQLIEAGRDNFVEAYRQAVQAEKYIPHDPRLSGCLSKTAVRISIRTDPPGARVSYKEYRTPDAAWESLGISPIENVRLPIGFFRWRLEKEGCETVLAVAEDYAFVTAAEKSIQPLDLFRVLDKSGSIPPGMVRVAGAQVAGVGKLADFFMDRCEVTNRQFKEFLDKGGYRKKDYWKQRFIKDKKGLTWEDAVREFVDQTGRPGPSTWQAGDYPQGQDDYPVSGVSWYEAAAYAEFAGKSLPTIEHWGLARGFSPYILTSGVYARLAQFSNFQNTGPAPVGSFPGTTGFGCYDLAGNVREWCWNEAPEGRMVRGGAWNDITYMFDVLSQASPFNRSPKNGFRCVVYPEPEKIPSAALAPAAVPETPDFYKEKPVPESVFKVYREQFSYDRTGLNPRVEWRREDARDWVEEKVSFDAAYENERVIAHLLLPKTSRPPYQTVIYFPGTESIDEKSSDNLVQDPKFEDRLSAIIKNGRAVLYPIYKGTFERRDEALAATDTNTHLYAEWVIKLVKDLRRAVDYLETRPDIDSRKLAYFGFSWGAANGPIIQAVENRLRAGVLALGGLRGYGRPEVNEFNYVSRVTIPTLMLNGRYDTIFPYETKVKPMFDLLGTPKEDKDLKLYENDHFIPRNELVKETLNWLDKYLGPVK